MSYLIVFLGAGIGGVLRHGVHVLMPHFIDTAWFPFDILTINLSGSFAMGLIAEYFVIRGLQRGLSQHLRLFLTTGILGGYTTFSAFSLDAVRLWQGGQVAASILYVVGSVAGSIGALALALALIRKYIRKELSGGP
jgi:CrcB protein